MEPPTGSCQRKILVGIYSLAFNLIRLTVIDRAARSKLAAEKQEFNPFDCKLNLRMTATVFMRDGGASGVKILKKNDGGRGSVVRLQPARANLFCLQD